MELHFSTIVNSPVERVFAYVGAPETWPQFETDFLEVRPLTADAKRPGAAYSFKRKMPGRVVEGQFKLTDYVPNQTILMQCDWVGPLKPGGGYLLEEVPEGTRVNMIERVEVRGPLRLFAPLLSLMFRSAGNAILRNLKHVVEHQQILN
ncbi:MAG TPA: SRPBCC family protein [Roseiflexaceae bacterium]|jgi:uncharacterized protein YndB with AHSA1/START domain